MLSSCALVLVRRPTPEKVPGSESWLGASLPCWPAAAFDERRFRELIGNVREPVDDSRRYPLRALQSHLPDTLTLTSHCAAVDRLPLRSSGAINEPRLHAAPGLYVASTIANTERLYVETLHSGGALI